jgi:hypothetical protein
VSESLASGAPDFRRQLFGAYSGLVFTAGLVIGWFGLAHGYLPAKASLSAEQTAQFFGAHQFGILLGCTIWLSAVALLTVWSAQLGLTLGRLEGLWPLLAITQMLCGGGIVVLVSLSACFWIGAAYRPDTDRHIIVALNDAAQFGLLLTWPLLTVQMISHLPRGAEGPQHGSGLPALAVQGVDRRGDRHGGIGRARVHQVWNLLVSRPSRVLRARRTLGPLARRPLGVHDQAHPSPAGRGTFDGARGGTVIELSSAGAPTRAVFCAAVQRLR